MTSASVQIRQKGIITIPVEFRQRYDLSQGDVLSMMDLGDGVFVLAPQRSQLTHHGDRVAKILQTENISLDDMLEALDEERRTYYQENYVQAPSVPG